MSKTNANAEYLKLLSDVCAVSSAAGTTSYVWGGLVVDILHGELLRPHHDIDCFTLGLEECKSRMIGSFQSLDCVITTLDEYQILRIDRDGVHAAFNPLEINSNTACWYHVGEHGRIEFPVAWLDTAPRNFHGIDVLTAGARLEYAIKTHPELLSPEWNHRPKDRDAIMYLKHEIEREGFGDCEFLREIRSITPFWTDRGYPEYARPIVISERSLHSYNDANGDRLGEWQQ